MNGVQTRLKCKPNVKRCKRFVFAAHSPLLHPNTLKTKAIIHFQTDHILTRFVFPPLYMAELYPDVNKNIIAQAIKRMVDSNTLPQNAVISPEAWKQAVALRHRMGDLKSLDNIESVLDMNFAEKAR